MNDEFIFTMSTPMEKQIETILDICDKLNCEKGVNFSNFGAKEDLTLYIYKNGEYEFDTGHLCSTFFTIYTKQNGKQVDKTSDRYITASTLAKELERIWNYKDFRYGSL